MQAYQVTGIKCSSCSEVFNGYLKEHPLGGVLYTVNCPECGTENNIDRVVGYFESAIPENAAIITEKQTTNS